MSRQKVLELLRSCPEEHLSGEEIAQRLGLSRAAVWKAICALRDDGYAIDAVTRGGYTLRADGGRLTAAAVTARLRTPGLAVTALENTDSTNSRAKKNCNDIK